jgi:G3E family GTPase
MSLPVLVVSGFLGCGKTSFLSNLLPLCSEAGVKPALVINEVGDTDIDGELLAELHTEQVKLVGGCVCCTLQAQLAQTIYDILDRAENDIIIIECSGLSNPIDVVSVLSTPALIAKVGVSHVVCLVDSPRADKILRVAELAKSQVAYSDLIILNKMDKVDEADREIVESRIREIASETEFIWATYGNIGHDRLLQLLKDEPSEHGCRCGHDHSHPHGHSHSLPASFCTTAVHLPECVERENLLKMLSALPDNVIRAKGFAYSDDIGWQVLHKVYDSVDITPLSGPAPNAGAILICIGQHLVPENIIDEVRRFT